MLSGSFKMVSAKLFDDMSPDSGLGQSRERAHSGSDTFDSGETELKESNIDVMALKSLLTDCGATSVSHLRLVLFSSVFKSLFLLQKCESAGEKQTKGVPVIAERHCSD